MGSTVIHTRSSFSLKRNNELVNYFVRISDGEANNDKIFSSDIRERNFQDMVVNKRCGKAKLDALSCFIIQIGKRKYLWIIKIGFY